MNTHEVIMHRDGIFIEHYHSLMKKKKKRSSLLHLCSPPPNELQLSFLFFVQWCPFGMRLRVFQQDWEL